jgi:hypothetical protein
MKKQPLPDFSVIPPNGLDLIIEGLLHRESLAPRKQQLCPDCGSKMRNVESTFSLFGTDRTWNVALPVCLRCDPISRPTAQSHIM